MREGDYAGLAAFQKHYGFVGVKMTGRGKAIVMVDGSEGGSRWKWKALSLHPVFPASI